MTRFLLGILLVSSAASLIHAQDRRVAVAQPSRRLALVIGNDAYPWKRLSNAVGDARAVAAALAGAGFASADITLATNTTLKQMQKAARDFIEKLRSDDLAFVYYSGHGVEVRGENYLVPVDFPENSSELEVRDEAYSAQQLLRGLEESAARTRILVLDACRNNPLRATRSAGGGLGKMDGQGTLIVFATGAGHVAEDNGLFRKRLVEALPTPGLSVDQMMRDVARSVYRDSGGKQTPAIYGLLLEDFSLVPGARVEPRLDTPMPPVLPETPRTKVNPKDGLSYLWIPPGTFTMGCSNGDRECSEDESPPHQVTLSKGFWLGKTEVTQEAYKRVAGNHASNFTGPHLPVERVTWNESQAYCRAVGMRLPTEAEWEYAARGGSRPALDEGTGAVAWSSENSGNRTHEVGQKQPNRFGLFDMLGNVGEWVADWYGSYVGAEATDPQGPFSGEMRVMRGGAWFWPAKYNRVSFRHRFRPDWPDSGIGFRCAGE